MIMNATGLAPVFGVVILHALREAKSSMRAFAEHADAFALKTAKRRAATLRGLPAGD